MSYQDYFQKTKHGEKYHRSLILQKGHLLPSPQQQRRNLHINKVQASVLLQATILSPDGMFVCVVHKSIDSDASLDGCPSLLAYQLWLSHPTYSTKEVHRECSRPFKATFDAVLVILLEEPRLLAFSSKEKVDPQGR